jgi:hypothetical protein
MRAGEEQEQQQKPGRPANAPPRPEQKPGQNRRQAQSAKPAQHRPAEEG